jgi:asparagine synthase (glutamine-hydrolysing)
LGFVPLPLRRGVSGLATRLLPVGFKGRNWLQACGADLDSELPLIATYFSQRERTELLRPEFARAVPQGAEGIRRQRIPPQADLLQRASRMDFENYLPEDILVKVDRASMLTSLEVRAPWLDFRLVEFAFGRVPSRLKATATARKILPKRLAQRLLPTEFDIQRKQGFSIPLALWLRGREWGGFFQQVLLDSPDSLFDRRALQKLLEGQERGRSNSERLFALVLFELWRREYRIAA